MRLYLIFLLLLQNCISQSKPTPEQSIRTERLFDVEKTIVSDNSKLFTTAERETLAERLIAYETETTNQIVIITVDSITPYTDIQKYAADLGNTWAIGQKNTDNGLAIVVSDRLRKIGIATGSGTEKILTDSICSCLIESTIIPQFRKDQYYRGISMGLDSLIDKWR
ncbi:MAG: TPM domain-containing protein [Pricia sp.]